MSVDGDQAIMLVSINASENGGELRIDLPRNPIDSKTPTNASENGGELRIDLPRNPIDSKTPTNTDKPFLVYEDDIDKTMSFFESKTTEKARALVIVFNNEDDTIQIQGTEVFSEYSEPGEEF
jgi:hypothetical protein